jgi:ArsR family transcriptional regulator
MDKYNVLEALSALGQETRLEVFRLLVTEGSNGLLAGEISDRLDVKQNTMSTNLAILQRAGLIRSERSGRTIRYCADIDGFQSMILYLLEDCCGGRPEMCQPLFQALGCSKMRKSDERESL